MIAGIKKGTTIGILRGMLGVQIIAHTTIYMDYYRIVRGDTRSSDYGSHGQLSIVGCPRHHSLWTYGYLLQFKNGP